MKDTTIEWAHHSMNWWRGCDKIAPECRNCYIVRNFQQTGEADKAFKGPIRCTSTWREPAKWHKRALVDGRQRVFTCSLSDFFHPCADEWRPEAWEIIRNCHALDWLILTKRIQFARDRMVRPCPPNVWLGVSCGCAMSYSQLDWLAEFSDVPIRFVSCEPLLEPLDLEPYLGWLDWVIIGGESGPNRRPMDLGWLREIRHACITADVPVFIKQDSHLLPGKQGRIPDAIWVDKDFPHGSVYGRAPSSPRA